MTNGKAQLPHLLRRNRQRIRKTPLKSMISEGFWSEWRGSNSRPRGPKPRVLSAELHPDIQFPPLYHGEGKNQRFFCLWSFMWSKPFLYRFRQSKKIQQTQVSQGFPAFHLAPSRIQPRHSQITCATNCATPGYSVFLHDTTRGRKKQVFRVCGWRCGQARFCGGIFRRGISAASYCPKDFRSSAFGGMDESSILPKQARYQLRYTRII